MQPSPRLHSPFKMNLQKKRVGTAMLAPPPFPSFSLLLPAACEGDRLGSLRFFSTSVEKGVWEKWHLSPNLQEFLMWKWAQGFFCCPPTLCTARGAKRQGKAAGLQRSAASGVVLLRLVVIKMPLNELTR